MRADLRGEAGWPRRHRAVGGDLSGRRECNKPLFGGSNSERGRICIPERTSSRPVGHRWRPAAATVGRDPYTAGLVSQRPALGCLFEIVETLVLTLIIFVVIQNFVAQPYKVQQLSMERTLEPEQYVLVDKLTPAIRYLQARRHRRLRAAGRLGRQDDTPFIKRVIGEAGDTIEIRDDGLVYINGIALDEPYLYADEPGGPPQPTTAPLEQRPGRSRPASCS